MQAGVDFDRVPLYVDNFLESYDELDEVARKLDYTGVTNPADGVFYPDISLEVPPKVAFEVKSKMQRWLGRPTDLTIFLRLSLLGVQAPHQAHEDSAMGHYGIILYVGDGPGSTTLLTHKETGMWRTPTTDEELEVWKRDTNIPWKWEVASEVKQKANRAFIFPTYFMHRAEPTQGYGQDVRDGRLVLTAFLK